LTATLVIKAEVDGSVCFQLLTIIVTKIPVLQFKIPEAPPNVTEVLNATWTPPANSTERIRQNLTVWVEAFSPTGVLNISFGRPIEIPYNLENFNDINRTYNNPTHLSEEQQAYKNLAYSINNWTDLHVLTKTRYDPDSPPRDIVNYWLLEITNLTMCIQINFTDYKLISESVRYPDILKIDFTEP
jgi:hypothetical protein